MNLKLRWWLVLSVAGGLALCGCGSRSGAGADGRVQVEISHFVEAEPLKVGTLYKTKYGAEFSVDKLRYYLSNFRLRRQDGSWFVTRQDPESSRGYYLIDEADAASKRISIDDVPPGEYTGIEFLVGIDATRNSSGVQTGTLDPARGLFWTWKTGYIFFWLDGHSPQAPADDGELSFHVGGSADPILSRTIFLPLGHVALQVKVGATPEVHLHVDIAQLFKASHRIRFEELQSAMDDKSGALIADNIAGLFRVDHVHGSTASGASDHSGS